MNQDCTRGKLPASIYKERWYEAARYVMICWLNPQHRHVRCIILDTWYDAIHTYVRTAVYLVLQY